MQHHAAYRRTMRKGADTGAATRHAVEFHEITPGRMRRLLASPSHPWRTGTRPPLTDCPVRPFSSRRPKWGTAPIYDQVREETGMNDTSISSARSCTIGLGAPVIARRGPGEPEFCARVLARTFGRQRFDVETADGEVLEGLTLVRPDDEAQAIGRVARALDGVAR